MSLPRRPDPMSRRPHSATTNTTTNTTTSTSATDRGSVTHRVVGVGLAAFGAVAVVGLLGPLATLAEGSASTVDASATPTPTVTPTVILEEAAVVEETDADEVLAVRLSTRIEHRATVIPAPEEQHDNDALPVGDIRIDQVGVDGMRQEIVEVTYRNGDVIDEQISEVVETAPTPTLVSIGTATSVAATKNWAALAQCESSGNPTIVSSSGRYHGLYQFDRSTWKSVGGTGLASEAPPDEQTRRAMALYDQRGASPWPTCGRHL